MSIKSALTKSAALAALSLALVGGSGLAAPQAEAGYKHKKFGVHIVLGAPVFYEGYEFHGHKHCFWLKKKAWATGSKYWWKRYFACKYGDDD